VFATGAPSAAAPAPANPDGVATADAIANQKIAFNGRLQLQVANLDNSLITAQSAIASLGGFISASRRSGGDQPVAAVTYRIPSDRWEDALTALRRLAVKVLDEQTDSSDQASQIVDLEARLKNLRAAETALQGIAAQATKISDILEVQARLTDLRGQIESLAAQQAAVSDKVAFATLNVTFGTEVVAVTQAAKQWDPAHEVDAATASVISFLQGLATAAIWFAIVWLPVLLVGGLLLWAALKLGRRVVPRLAALSNAAPQIDPDAGHGGTMAG
jgi:hypothetical protein